MPLVASMAAITVMEFTDRVFLANYSLDAIAAATPAGVAAFLVLTLFVGTASYINVFIAQYIGADQQDRIGPCLWQGIYFSLAVAVILTAVSFLSAPIFKLAGHSIEVQRLEQIYFRILCLGGGMHVLGTGLACFFSGQGRTRPVMVINIVAMFINIPLDYALINGYGIIPEMGIRGAGMATVFSWMFIVLCYCPLIFNRKNETAYRIWSGRGFERDLFVKILFKGGASGLQFSLDVLAFTFFIFMVGRLGDLELAISNIVFSIHSIAFMPTIGFSIGLSILVGQSLGNKDIYGALEFTWQTIVILLFYMGLLGIFFILVPEKILILFLSSGTSESHAMMVSSGKMIIRIMAGFICFDAMYFTFLGVLKGAGDIRFVMWSIGLATVFVMIIPMTIIVSYTEWGLVACWLNLTAYVLTLFSVSFFRFRQSKWKASLVI